jgi:putative membrane protein
MIILFISFLILSTVASSAHGGNVTPSEVWRHWNLSPLMLAALAVPVVLYARGALTYRVDSRRIALFASGIAMLAVAFISPLDALSRSLVAAHSAQHIVLILAAAPMLVWSAPGPPILRGLPRTWRRPLGLFFADRRIQTVWRVVRRPLPAACIHVLALTIWHHPALYEISVASPFAQTLEHPFVFLSAMLFWWTIAFAQHFGARLAAVVAVMVISSGLGALLAQSNVAWYSVHSAVASAWGLAGIEDQKLAGSLLWMAAGALYTATAAGLLGDWIERQDRWVKRRRTRRILRIPRAAG